MAVLLFDPQFWLTPKILSSVIGASLLLMGITGGDFQITSIRIPKIEGYWRVVASVASVAFLLFGFGLLDGMIRSGTAQTAITGITGPEGKPAGEGQPASLPTAPRPSGTASDVAAPPKPTAGSAAGVSESNGTPAGATTAAAATPPAQPAFGGTRDTVQITVSDSLGNDQLWETVDLRVGNLPPQRMSVTRDHRKSALTFTIPAQGETAYQMDHTQQRSTDGQTVRAREPATLTPPTATAS